MELQLYKFIGSDDFINTHFPVYVFMTGRIEREEEIIYSVFEISTGKARVFVQKKPIERVMFKPLTEVKYDKLILRPKNTYKDFKIIDLNGIHQKIKNQCYQIIKVVRDMPDDLDIYAFLMDESGNIYIEFLPLTIEHLFNVVEDTNSVKLIR